MPPRIVACRLPRTLEMRAELLRSASGRTLEIGAGTGLNLGHYPDAVTELVLTEPDPHMAKRLRRKLEAGSPVGSVEVIEAGAEELPYEASSFDTVVSTLVLCSGGRAGRIASSARGAGSSAAATPTATPVG